MDASGGPRGKRGGSASCVFSLVLILYCLASCLYDISFKYTDKDHRKGLIDVDKDD